VRINFKAARVSTWAFCISPAVYKLSYEKASAILALLGFEKVQDETWGRLKINNAH